MPISKGHHPPSILSLRHGRWGFWAAFGIVLLVCLGCSGGYLLDVGYQLPALSRGLQGERLALAVRDARSDSMLFTRRAADSFAYFTDRYRLLLRPAVGEPIAEGVFELEALFHEAFRRRLQALGAVVLEDSDATAATLTVTIQSLQLDIQGSRWLGQLELEVQIDGPGRRRATQRVAVSGERFRAYGRAGASELLGSLFTEAVNKPDLGSMLRSSQRGGS